MKKYISYIILLLIILTVSLFKVCATDNIDTDTLTGDINQELSDIIDKDVKDTLEELGVYDFSFDEIYKISFTKITDYFSETLKDKVGKFTQNSSQLFCIIILCSVFATIFDAGTNSAFNFVCTVIIILLSVTVVADSIAATISVLETSGKFTIAFAPIYTLLISLTGNTSLALTYNTFVVFLGEVISSAITFGVNNFIGIYFALGISFSTNESINLSKFISIINKIINTALGLSATVFSGFLSLKSILSISMDKVSVKSIRFLISSMIPVVGSSISDAYSSLIGSINLIKGSVAFVGIIVIIIINLPIIIENFVGYIVFTVLSYIAESFLSNRVADVLRLFACGLKILLLLSVFEMFIIIITVGITLSVRGGV